MKEMIIFIGFFIFCISILTFIAFQAFNQPYVYKSWSRQECVYIEFADGTKADCDKLDEISSYELIWVE